MGNEITGVDAQEDQVVDATENKFHKGRPSASLLQSPYTTPIFGNMDERQAADNTHKRKK